MSKAVTPAENEPTAAESPDTNPESPKDDEVERAKQLAAIEEELNTCRTAQDEEYTTLVEDERREWRRVRIDGARSARAAKDAEQVRIRREEKQKELNDRNEVLDYWAPIKSARSGAITFTVVRAENLGGFFASAMLHTNPYVVVKYGDQIEVESEVVRNDECPEFDFETYFAVEDDTKPILVTVMERTLSSRYGVGMIIGSTTVDLRREYENLAKSAPDGVYTEKCSVIQPLYDTAGNKLSDMKVTIEWMLRLRVTNNMVFCDECGRLDVRCTCSPEEKQARRDALAQELRVKQLQTLAARNLRVTEEEEVAERTRIVDETQFGFNSIARAGNVDLARIRAAIRRKRLAERKGGAGANAAAEAAEVDEAAEKEVVEACANAGMPATQYDPVDLYARDDTNLRGVPDAVIVSESKPKEDKGGCCIVA
uniref:C2 domain-containing protein n=1 Tax=Neobodo designis TaxID=312471 RepID=A0A7S1QCX9_NEODS|eukprot:CAMPEP_0174854158 /NCGR_PEP_ID=MMETSP1114-20130205/30212_1 /TAXON_ID=312471 /ORGANISM="Neobodo designis, Strain CCAP 1951/1" /LENGTH=426 /DNA_ID=CAMNT_0016088835 /DNA_START=27 /DNA_END=1307 /DNA_ORIENTATION=+